MSMASVRRSLPLALAASVLVASSTARAGTARAESPSTAPSAPSRPASSLSALAERALAAHPALAAAAERRRAAAAERREAAAALKPSLTLSATAAQYQEPAIVAPLHGFDLRDLPQFDRSLLQPGLRASYSLFDGGLRRARVEQLGAVEEATARAGEQLEQSLLARVGAFYFEALALAEALAADDARLAALAAERQRAATLFEAGRAAALELRRAEAALATAEADRVQRASRLDLAERELARLCGMEPGETRAEHLLQPAGTVPVAKPSREELLARALAASPRVAAAEAAVHAAEAGLAAARSGGRPTLAWFANELAYTSSKGDISAEWSTGLQLSWSLFDGGAADERTARAVSLVAAARADARQARLEVESALDGALAREAEALARRDSLGAAVASFEEVTRVEALRLEAEAGVQSDYLSAVAQLASVRAALAETRYRALQARVEIAATAAELDAAWFDRELGTAAVENTAVGEEER